MEHRKNYGVDWCAVEKGRTDNGSACTTQFYVYYCFYCLFFVHTALSFIQYDRLALLEIRSSLNTEFFSTYWSACCGSFVLYLYTNTPTEEKEERQACWYSV